MARGVKVQIDAYLASIKPYIIKGASMREACLSAGIPYRTVKDYYDNEEAVRTQIDAWENLPIWEARKTLLKGIKNDPDLALKFLERKRKDEFSTKSTVDGHFNYSMMQNVKINGQEKTFNVGEDPANPR